jgi:tetratricopeptide (TPR) repeat protein
MKDSITLPYLARAEKYNHKLPAVHFYKARLADLKGDRLLAKTYLEQSLEVNPMHLPSRMMLVSNYYIQTDKDKAYQVLKQAIRHPHVLHDPMEFYQLTLSLAKDRGEDDDIEILERKIRRYHIKKRKGSSSKDPDVNAFHE